MQSGDKQPLWKTEAENNLVTTVLRKIFQNETDVISLRKFSGGGRHRNYQTNAKREMKRLTSQYSRQFQDYLHSRRTIGVAAVRSAGTLNSRSDFTSCWANGTTLKSTSVLFKIITDGQRGGTRERDRWHSRHPSCVHQKSSLMSPNLIANG